MEPSTELGAVVARFFAAMNAADTATCLNLLADEPGTTFIGTDPDEWYSDLRTFEPVMSAQLREFVAAGAKFDLGNVEASCEGTVGWVAARPSVLRPDGTTSSLRFTAVLHLDHGVWRFVQYHASEPVENEATLGFELPTTVEHLATAVLEERPDLGGVAAPDGTVTIAFTDIERSTETAVRLGDHKWVDLLRWHDGIVSAETTRAGGHVVKSLGDGHMLAFPSASRALRAVAQIQRLLQPPRDGEKISIRIGLHTGEVLREADDFIGQAVIMAARVAAEAHGDEILVSTLVRELTRSTRTFEFGEPRAARLKGIPGRHRLFPLLWERLES